MKRLFLYGSCGAVLMLSALGCATCCSPDLYSYPTFGGRYERVDREYGRVGSIFSDPTAVAGAPAPRQSGEPVQILPDNSSPAEELELPAPRGDSVPPVNPPQNSGGGTSTGSSSSHPTRSGRTRWR